LTVSEAGEGEKALWHHGKVAGIFRDLGPRPMAEELSRVVSELHRLGS
jgi:hypothetical protein